MGQRRSLSPAVREEALRLAATGLTNTEIAKRLDVAEATVRAWRRKADGGSRVFAPLPASMRGRARPALSDLVREAERADLAGQPAPKSVALPVAARASAEEPDAPELDLGDLEGTLTRFVETATKNAHSAARDGNHTAAQRGMKDAANLVNLLMRARRERRDQSENLTITREELAATERTLRDRVNALLEKPLVCARCSREIAIGWGRTVKEDINVGNGQRGT